MGCILACFAPNADTVGKLIAGDLYPGARGVLVGFTQES